MAGIKIKTPGSMSGTNCKMTFRAGFGADYTARFHKAQVFVDSEALRIGNSMAPIRTGNMITQSILGTVLGSGLLRYLARYTLFQYKRKTMQAKDPMRGGRWFDRMSAMHGQRIMIMARKIIGGG